MLYAEEQSRLSSLKQIVSTIKDDFQTKSSFIIKIAFIYLISTIIVISIFLIVSTSNQMKLLSDKISKETEVAALNIYSRMFQIMQTSSLHALLKSQYTRRQNLAINKITQALQVSQVNQEMFLTNDFFILSSEGDYKYSLSSGFKKSKLYTKNKAELKNIISAFQRKELNNQNYYTIPGVEQVDLYIPLTNAGYQDFIFKASIPILNLKQEKNKIIKTAFFIILIIIIIQILISSYIYISVLQPVKNLTNIAHKVAEGDLEIQAIEKKRSDEIGHLVYLFNKMVRSLNEKTAGLSNTIEVLEKHNQILYNELEMGEEIQKGMMPYNKKIPNIHYDIYFQALEKVSGDYFDILKLANERFAFLIVDVSGHGIPAALITIMAKFYFSSVSHRFESPSKILAAINKHISKSIVTSDYLTAFFLILNPDLTLEYTNASHQKALIYRHQTKQIIELDTQGFFIGAIEDVPVEYETLKIQLKHKDRIILYTDGIVEGKSLNKEEYGMERFKEKISTYAHLDVKKFNQSIIKDVDDFASEEKRQDDYTLFTLEILDPRV